MKMPIIILSIVLAMAVFAMTGCARVNTIDFTPTGFITKTRGEVDIECEFLPDGTKKAKFSSKKGPSIWERIGKMIPNNVGIGQ